MQWQPWKYSTGARTPQGKAVSSQNAFKPDSVWRLLKEVQQLLKEVKAKDRWK